MDRDKSADLLGRHAADAQLLAVEAKAWHWMVTGPTFGELHELFEQIAQHARAGTDLIAERIVQLGGTPPAFPNEWLERTGLEMPEATERTGADQMLAHIDQSMGRISDVLREDIIRIQDQDAASADILTQWLRMADKDRWMVQAHRG